jgi:hypothetical protein
MMGAEKGSVNVKKKAFKGKNRVSNLDGVHLKKRKAPKKTSALDVTGGDERKTHKKRKRGGLKHKKKGNSEWACRDFKYVNVAITLHPVCSSNLLDQTNAVLSNI